MLSRIKNYLVNKKKEKIKGSLKDVILMNPYLKIESEFEDMKSMYHYLLDINHIGMRREPYPVNDVNGTVKRYVSIFFRGYMKGYRLDPEFIDNVVDLYFLLLDLRDKLNVKKVEGTYGFNYNVVDKYIIELEELFRLLLDQK